MLRYRYITQAATLSCVKHYQIDMYITESDIDEIADDSIKYYDVNAGKTTETWQDHKMEQQVTHRTAVPDLCCLCATCPCLCHSNGAEQAHFNNENFVRYLFDYDLFSIAHNFSRCGYLITYLQHEGIIGNACVVVTDSHSLHGPYARPLVSKPGLSHQNKTNDSMRVDLSRSVSRGNLEFRRPTNLIEPLVDTPDVRMLMRNYVLSDPSRDWLDLRYALQMPTFLIYVKLDGSSNHLPTADFTAMFDLRQLRIIESGVSVGRRLAELVAGIREKYFGIALPDFDLIEQTFSNRLLDRSLKKHHGAPSIAATRRHPKHSSDDQIKVNSGSPYGNADSAIFDPSPLFIPHKKH